MPLSTHELHVGVTLGMHGSKNTLSHLAIASTALQDRSVRWACGRLAQNLSFLAEVSQNVRSVPWASRVLMVRSLLAKDWNTLMTMGTASLALPVPRVSTRGERSV